MEQAPHPKGYVCYRTERPPRLNGRIDDPVWRLAPWTDDFVDIEGDLKPKPRFRTRAKMLWDDRALYIAVELEEPDVWGTLTEHDSVIFQDNDIEVFMDPDGDNHNYYELEINALNTTWDLRLVKPYLAGGPALNEWEIVGLKTAVDVQGKINDPTHRDRGWSVEMMLPWKPLGEFAKCPCPPRPGDQWRINFSRVEWDVEVVDGKYKKIAGRPEHNWVWSPQGVIDMHRPERWGYLQFSEAPAGREAFRPDPHYAAKAWLHAVWHAQNAYRKKHGKSAPTLAELGLPRADARYIPDEEWVVEAGGWMIRWDYRLERAV